MTQEELEAKEKKITERFKPGAIELDKLEDHEIYTLIAYELWKDGMDWQLIPEIAQGRSSYYQPRQLVTNILRTVFQYT